MAESVHDQIADRIVTVLSAITGDAGTTYWETPNVVTRVPVFPRESDLDSSQALHYLLRPGYEELREGLGYFEGYADFFLVGARRYATGGTSRWTYMDRMVRDAVKALAADINLGMGSDVVTNVFGEGTVRVNRETEQSESWVFVELFWTTAYRFQAGTP